MLWPLLYWAKQWVYLDRRLAGRPNSLVFAAAAYLAAIAVLLGPTVAMAVPWLTELQRLLSSAR